MKWTIDNETYRLWKHHKGYWCGSYGELPDDLTAGGPLKMVVGILLGWARHGFHQVELRAESRAGLRAQVASLEERNETLNGMLESDPRIDVLERELEVERSLSGEVYAEVLRMRNQIVRTPSKPFELLLKPLDYWRGQIAQDEKLFTPLGVDAATIQQLVEEADANG